MKTVQLSELGAVADDVKNGETVEVRDGETIVATVVPFRQQTIEERIDELAREGKVRKGTGTLPDWFFNDPLPPSGTSAVKQIADRPLEIPKGTVPDWFFEEPPPKFPESVLEQLLHDRHSRDW